MILRARAGERDARGVAPSSTGDGGARRRASAPSMPRCATRLGPPRPRPSRPGITCATRSGRARSSRGVPAARGDERARAVEVEPAAGAERAAHVAVLEVPDAERPALHRARSRPPRPRRAPGRRTRAPASRRGRCRSTAPRRTARRRPRIAPRDVDALRLRVLGVLDADAPAAVHDARVLADVAGGPHARRARAQALVAAHAAALAELEARRRGRA